MDMKTKDANRYICDGCGAEIVGRKAYDILQKAKYGKGLRGFCSMHCYHSSIKLDEKQCEQCSKVFTPKDITQKYCCHSCSAKSSNKNRNYDFLNSYKYGECIECKEKTHVRSSTNIFNLKCKNCKVKDGKKHIYDGKVITISECRLCSNKYSYTSRGSRFKFLFF